MSRPNPVPKRSGVYAWYFKEPPPGIDTRHCHTSDGKTLLYIGIAPRPPYADGRTAAAMLLDPLSVKRSDVYWVRS
jgi:hypothetical protein